MVKLDATGYNDEDATADKSNFAPSFGIFDAKILKVVPAKKDGEFEMKISKGNQKFYSARVVFGYKIEENGEKKIKEKLAFFNFGLWFPELTKQLLEATSMDSPEGRAGIMGDTDALVGNVVKIAVGAKEKDYGDRAEFEGFELGEYDGKPFIANEILGIYKKGTKNIPFNADEELALRERFKKSQGGDDDGGMQTADAPATESDLADEEWG